MLGHQNAGHAVDHVGAEDDLPEIGAVFQVFGHEPGGDHGQAGARGDRQVAALGPEPAAAGRVEQGGEAGDAGQENRGDEFAEKT